MIRSLKRALQPAITDVSVLFQLPKGYEVLQSPQNLPPIFNGEKLVAYGMLKSKAASKKIIECTATLRGNTLGAKVEHKVPFILDSSTAAQGLPVIHHLAAKALITDWESEQKEKKSIVDLSIESCVISSYTAFIAIDEESSEPVSGAMKTYDIRARWHGSILYSGFDSDCMLGDSEDDEDEERILKQRLEKDEEQAAADKKLGLTNLTQIITAQQLNGSWTLNASLAQLIGKSLSDLECTCPIDRKGVGATVWATVLAMSLLRSRYSSQQEEWELIVMKAESWLKKQSLPPGYTLELLFQAAQRFL